MRILTAQRPWRGAGCLRGGCRMGPQSGVGLVETIIAIGIVVAAMNILAQVFVAGLDASAEARDRATAALLAQEKLEEILSARDNLPEWEKAALEAHERAGPDGAVWFDRPGLERFQWSWRMQDLEDRPGLKDVVVQVWWRKPRADRWNAAPPLRTLVAVPSPQADEATVTPGEGTP